MQSRSRISIMILLVLGVGLLIAACGQTQLAEPDLGDTFFEESEDEGPVEYVGPDPSVLFGSASSRGGGGSLAQDLLNLVNAERQNSGLVALTLNSQLTQAAQSQADYIASTGVLSHTGAGGSTPGQRVSATGYQWCLVGENVLVGFTTAQDAFTAWMNSSGHRANILYPGFRETGIATATSSVGTWWAEVFATQWQANPDGTYTCPSS